VTQQVTQPVTQQEVTQQAVTQQVVRAVVRCADQAPKRGQVNPRPTICHRAERAPAWGASLRQVRFRGSGLCSEQQLAAIAAPKPRQHRQAGWPGLL
jgi:hypothetical protein